MLFHWSETPDGAVLTGCGNPVGAVVVPDTALGLPVIGIDARAFLGAVEMTEIALPPTLTAIGENAFLGCAGLHEVRLPDSVTALGSGAFEGCSALESVRLSKGLTELPRRAFYLCRSLTAVEVPETVSSIGESAFAGCERLSNVVLQEGLHVLGPGAFASCASLRALRVPRSVYRMDATSLPAQLFTGGGLYLPGSGLLVRAIARLQWQAPEGTMILADGALAGNHDLTEVTLPDTVIAIGARAFADCRCLHGIRLPRGPLLHIGAGAFRDCAKLTAIDLPHSLALLPEGVFENSGLQSAALPEIRFVGNRAFASCAALETVTFGPNLSCIGAQAFARCASLKAITLPERRMTIGREAFLGCTALETLTVPGEIPRGFDTALTDLRRVAIVAPKQPPEAFPPLWRKRVCLGFALAVAQGMPIPPEVFDANLNWIRAHAAALAGEAAAHPELLRLMLDHRCLPEADARRFVDRFSRQDEPELTLELLHYVQGAENIGTEALW